MTPWNSAFQDANGITIHYTRTGGARPPVLMLHGLAGSGACWTHVARLLENDFDLIMPDARGHGKSSAPRSGYRYDDLADDAIGLVRALHLDGVTLLGHSMGGLTAAVAANRLGADVRGLVLVEPTFLSLEMQRMVHESGVVEQHRRALEMSHDELLTQTRSRHARRSPEIVALQVEARLQTSVSAFDVLTPPNPDYRELLWSIQAPTLFVVGDSGMAISDEVVREVATLNSRLEIARLEKASHGVHFDQPERFAEAVRHFLLSL